MCHQIELIDTDASVSHKETIKHTACSQEIIETNKEGVLELGRTLMDSGTSCNSSGIKDRISNWVLVDDVALEGFNGALAPAEQVGTNSDGKKE